MLVPRAAKHGINIRKLPILRPQLQQILKNVSLIAYQIQRLLLIFITSLFATVVAEELIVGEFLIWLQSKSGQNVLA